MKELLEMLNKNKGKIEYNREIFIEVFAALYDAMDKNDPTLDELLKLEPKFFIWILCKGIEDLFQTIESDTNIHISYLVLLAKSLGIESIFNTKIADFTTEPNLPNDKFTALCSDLSEKIKTFMNNKINEIEETYNRK